VVWLLALLIQSGWLAIRITDQSGAFRSKCGLLSQTDSELELKKKSQPSNIGLVLCRHHLRISHQKLTSSWHDIALKLITHSVLQIQLVSDCCLMPTQQFLQLYHRENKLIKSPKQSLGDLATNSNFIVFGLTRSGLKPTIYHTLGKYANHYTTDAVNINLFLAWYSFKIAHTFSN
jgi:hypothetical protein